MITTYILPRRITAITSVFGTEDDVSTTSEAANLPFHMTFRKTNKRANKYNAKKVVIDGIEFDSTKEGKRYLVLKKAQEDGIISELTLQPRWDALPAKKETYVEHLKTKDKVKERVVVRPIQYTADFSYIKDWKLVVEDVKPCKGLISRDLPLRVKLMKYFHDIDVRLVYDANAPV